MKIHEHLEQGTEEWLHIRLGKITGSEVAALMTKGRGKDAYFGKTALDYIDTKVVEKLTKFVPDSFDNSATRWGNELEDVAIAEYERKTWRKVGRVGFVEQDEYVGASPDGVFFQNESSEIVVGIIEVKCPYNSVNHFKTVKSGEVPAQYLPQVYHNMWVTGAEYCDFISYDPRFPENLQLKVIRVEREEVQSAINELVERVEEAIRLIKGIINELEEK